MRLGHDRNLESGVRTSHAKMPLCYRDHAAIESRAPHAWIAHGSYEPEASASEWMVPSYESQGGIHSLALRARIQVDAVIVCNPSVRRSTFATAVPVKGRPPEGQARRQRAGPCRPRRSPP